ncbi:hypothetical protein [Nocardiopsis synnemataformans]|uniref:hypothetical protein n=1 Tax=Nocardiopsis synnemataformans TaxID=61305 RepID=UPI003EB8F9DF
MDIESHAQDEGVTVLSQHRRLPASAERVEARSVLFRARQALEALEHRARHRPQELADDHEQIHADLARVCRVLERWD